ncbi:MAG: glycosyltransferase [Blautia sp.]|nr:glycosyltransferase [Lachnoclostridium sp.]MCM1211530.1 glycosyltransferase [Blautia sp.]
MENKEALISVIVPVHNGQDYLAECIKSIEGQTYPHLEIIIVNDGSTDRTDSVCDKLCETYGNIRVITMEDEGVSAARNAGLEAAAGGFISFVDADDRLLPGMFQVLYDCMTDTESDISGCRFFLWKEEAEWEQNQKEYPKAPRRVFTLADYIKDGILQGNSRCWSKLYRRETIGDIRFRKGLSIGEDMLFLLDLLPAAEKITESEYTGYGYFQNPNGAIKRQFTPEYMDQITCWELARDKIMELTADQKLYTQATTNMLMGIMLTVGKLAMLSGAERRDRKQYVELCHEKLKEALEVPGAFQKLSGGYRIKVWLFMHLPECYLALYHCKKQR